MSQKNKTEIYLISPPIITLDTFLPNLKEALSTGYIGVFQLRLKNISNNDYEVAAREVVSCCHDYGVMCLINDKVEVAAAVGADGVHLGKEDSSYQEARQLLGGDKVIGISCYNSIDDAIIAVENGANYVAFGSFYPTLTKKDTVKASPEILRWWMCNSTIPCVAIGGINEKNVGSLVECGVDFIAVISTVWNHPKGTKYALEALYCKMVECGIGHN
jgi:thiamine-phosphate pyrophosphorylase